LFPGRSKKQINAVLKTVQDKDDEIWRELDKKNATSSKNSSQIYEDFKKVLQSYLSRTFTTQTKAINDARWILEQSSFGIVFYNMQNEVLGVQNHNGTWSAVKGHRRIKNDGTLETPWETCLRELFEELSIKLETNKRKKTITKENIGLLAINKTNFVQYHVDSKRGTNDRLRLIGLFYVHIDEKKFKFSLKDNKENKMSGWLNMNDILNNKPEIGRDIYYTLRPFVQLFKDLPKS
jgi:ADP-ribose pyrophosphatase YjhB (NUDIX family)